MAEKVFAMTHRMTLEAILTAVAEQTTAAAAVLPRALSNLAEMRGGYPTSTPGAAPASGPGGVPDGLNPVERAATTRDPVADAQRELDRLIVDMGVKAKVLSSLMAEWGTAKHQLPLDLELEYQFTNCVNCLRVHKLEDRYRGNLCSWCYSFKNQYGWVPTLYLLDVHHSSRRVTSAMIERERLRSVQTNKTKRKRSA